MRRKEAKMMRNMKRPLQDDRHHPKEVTFLQQHGDGGCGKSLDAMRFPLSITAEGVEVTVLPNPAPKFFHFPHKYYCRSW